MNRAGIREIKDKICALCSQEAAINAAYVFGSQAKGSTGPESDLDVAFLLNEGLESDFSLLPFMANLERAYGYRVDVVILNHAGEMLKYEVRRSGRLIFERDSVKRKKFEISGRKRYEDFLHLHRRYAGAVLYGEERG